MSTDRKNQQDINDTAQGRSTGPGGPSPEAGGGKAAESFDQIAARLAGVGDQPAELSHQQRPTQQEPTRGQPDASEVDRMTAAVEKAWGLETKAESRAEGTGPSQRPSASAAPPRSEATPSRGAQAWEQFSGGLRDGLADFVMRLHGERSSPSAEHQPEHDQEGRDR